MENNTNNDLQKKPNIKMIGIILAVVILIVLVVVALTSNKGSENNNTEVNTETGTNTEQTQPIVNEAGEEVEVVVTESGQIIPEGSRVEVAGANPIKDNIVVTPKGEAAKNDAVPMSPDAPQQTPPMPKAELPSSAIKLDVLATGFSPSSFEVKAGAPTTLSVTSADDSTHVFMFDDNALQAVAIGVGPGETRAITFNAPATSGEYTFRCDVPGHSMRGEVGKMIVK